MDRLAPNFKVGDRVKFLAAKCTLLGYFYPVWSGPLSTADLDRTTERWIEGKVIEVDAYGVSVSYHDPLRLKVLEWHWVTGVDWLDLPGYLTRADVKVEQTANKCVCAWDLVLRQGCQCGAMARERAAKPKPKHNLRDYL